MKPKNPGLEDKLADLVGPTRAASLIENEDITTSIIRARYRMNKHPQSSHKHKSLPPPVHGVPDFHFSRKAQILTERRKQKLEDKTQEALAENQSLPPVVFENESHLLQTVPEVTAALVDEKGRVEPVDPDKTVLLVSENRSDDTMVPPKGTPTITAPKKKDIKMKTTKKGVKTKTKKKGIKTKTKKKGIELKMKKKSAAKVISIEDDDMEEGWSDVDDDMGVGRKPVGASPIKVGAQQKKPEAPPPPLLGKGDIEVNEPFVLLLVGVALLAFFRAW